MSIERAEAAQLKTLGGTSVIMLKFAAGFLTATVLAGLAAVGYHAWLSPLHNHVVATRPIGLLDFKSKIVVTLPAGTELYTVYSVTRPPADDYGSDAFVAITINDIREATALGLQPVPNRRHHEIPSLQLVAAPAQVARVPPN